jgi:hypothetical protein
MNLVQLKLNKEKEIQTIKLNASYHGVILVDENVFITEENFESPLRAANYARKLKKEKKINSCSKERQSSLKTKIKPKIIETIKLLTEADVAGHTPLHYREIWVIVSPSGTFVHQTLKEGSVVKYGSDRDKAQIFKTYEDAITMANTLNCVVKCGHTLKRFFIENKSK